MWSAFVQGVENPWIQKLKKLNPDLIVVFGLGFDLPRHTFSLQKHNQGVHGFTHEDSRVWGLSGLKGFRVSGLWLRFLGWGSGVWGCQETRSQNPKP